MFTFLTITHIILVSFDICRVDTNLKKVLHGLEKLEAPKSLIDPLKLYITAQDGTPLDECVAAVEETEDHHFELKNVFLNQRAKGTPQFNIMLPEK